ncbi:hypothetical protein ACGFH8_07925 [Micromonospora sp. NPDC049175]|uniref:hypothetical protein n=1 Tax=Micromonospora sp. NPDC049175 TaxID=3364266 RepID=UPI00371B799F
MPMLLLHVPGEPIMEPGGEWRKGGSDYAWEYELVGLTGASGTGPYLSARIPDATPEGGPFTPRPASEVVVSCGGDVPWLILRRFIHLVESFGDIVQDPT